jgi:hypothetical protein
MGKERADTESEGERNTSSKQTILSIFQLALAKQFGPF